MEMLGATKEEEIFLTVCSRPVILGSSNALLRAKGDAVVMVDREWEREDTAFRISGQVPSAYLFVDLSQEKTIYLKLQIHEPNILSRKEVVVRGLSNRNATRV